MLHEYQCPDLERGVSHAREETGGGFRCLVCVSTVMARQPRMYWASQYVSLW